MRPSLSQRTPSVMLGFGMSANTLLFEAFPAPGYVWTGEVILRPAVLEVTGPRQSLAGLDSVRLRPVSIAGRRDTLRVQVTPEGLPEGCVAEPGLVRVLVPLKRSGERAETK